MYRASAKVLGVPIWPSRGPRFSMRISDDCRDIREEIEDCLSEMGIETGEDLLALLEAVKDGAFGDGYVL